MSDSGISTLLTYALSTSPSPLTASPAQGDPVFASLSFVVSCPDSVGSAVVSQIAITVPVRSDAAGGLTDTAPSKPASIASSDGTEWTSPAPDSSGMFSFTPRNGQSATINKNSLSISIPDIQISEVPGTASITITEWAAAGQGPTPSPEDDPSGVVSVVVSKFAPGTLAGTVLANFAAGGTSVDYGETATLSWDGAENATFSLEYGDNVTADVSAVRTWTSPPLESDTAFQVTATYQQDGVTKKAIATTEVTVNYPIVHNASFSPSTVGLGESTTLIWEVLHADGAYLFEDHSSQRTLGTASSSTSPVTVTPGINQDFFIQAFKNCPGNSSPYISDMIPVGYTFKPPQIENFTVQPSTVDEKVQTATLSWNTTFASAVQLDDVTSGTPVSISIHANSVPNGKADVAPSRNSVYRLTAIGGDGKTTTFLTRRVTVKPVAVTPSDMQVSFSGKAGRVSASIYIPCRNVSGGVVSNASIKLHNGLTVSAGSGTVTPVASYACQCDLEAPYMGGIAEPPKGFTTITFDWRLDGIAPKSGTGLSVEGVLM